MNEPANTVIIAGGSVRSAAASALRAGLRPWCIDCFADVDLARACPAQAIATKAYPDALPSILASSPVAPWMYTGALENRPDVIAQVPRPLWGNPAEVVREVRDSARLAQVLERAQLSVPRV